MSEEPCPKKRKEYAARTTSGSLSSAALAAKSGSSRFGQQDGATLHLLILTESGFDLRKLKLETGEIDPPSFRPPRKATIGSAAVACGDRIFILGGGCSWSENCPEGRNLGVHNHDYVSYFDRQHPEEGWKEAASISVERRFHSAVTIAGQIYVFGGQDIGPFAEVFDIGKNSWAPLPPPPNIDTESASCPVLLDSSRRRILVHFSCNNSLYAYKVDKKSWDCLTENFGDWSPASVIVDDVVYGMFEGLSPEWLFFFSENECSFRGYDVVENKFLSAKWLSKSQVNVPQHGRLFHLGNGNLCYAWYNPIGGEIDYIKFHVSKDSRKISVTGESEYTAVKVGYTCGIWLL